jgi:type VI protein secretion system component VasK
MWKIVAILLVAVLAFGGWELGHRANHAVGGTISTLAISIPDQASLAVAEDNLTQAATAATAYQAANGSFEGMTVPAATVRSATATTYCLEATVRGVTAHLSGPNGTPAAGSC